MTNIEDIRQATASVALANGRESADQAVKSERRREGARKAAATVRARRMAEQAEKTLADSLDRIAARVVQARTQAEAQIAQAVAEPAGTPTARELIGIAIENDAEAALHRLAHEARLGWKPSEWSAETRTRLSNALTEWLRTRKTPKAKGGRK
jgi:hypothetical protein